VFECALSIRWAFVGDRTLVAIHLDMVFVLIRCLVRVVVCGVVVLVCARMCVACVCACISVGVCWCSMVFVYVCVCVCVCVELTKKCFNSYGQGSGGAAPVQILGSFLKVLCVI
jgi:hypothetical protein